jgi:hypothetical protein
VAQRSWFPGLAIALATLVAGRAHALSLKESNIVDLLKEADDIVVGKVTSVTDGIDEKGVPYTEVTLDIEQSIRGHLSGTYTFRQFGLLKPRLTPDGKRKMMPAPEGFPRYTAGQTHLLFFHPVAAWTGLRTTARLGYGRFTMGPGRLDNDMGNVGLFHHVKLDKKIETAADRRLMAGEGAVNPDAFLAFIKRAVHEHWIESGLLTREGGAR